MYEGHGFMVRDCQEIQVSQGQLKWLTTLDYQTRLDQLDREVTLECSDLRNQLASQELMTEQAFPYVNKLYSDIIC